ncbi:MAG: hypothetical protein SVG88_04500 [Halobacteriales archaeon]|nr:hypothetical protein [Halobacteriales archaeon]
MQPFPSTPPLADATLTGHLWVQELVTGGPLRFQVAESGLITFGTPESVVETPEELSLPYRRATQSVREHLDRDAFRAAVDRPDSVTFFGRATWWTGLDYEWSTVPPFLGIDVWSGRRDAYLSPDAAAGVFERLGLAPLPAINKEIPARDIQLDRYSAGEALPDARWYDGPVAGLLIRDKAGGRGRIWRSDLDDHRPDPLSEPASELADRFVTEHRLERAVTAVRQADEFPGIDPVLQRTLADIGREAAAWLYRDDSLVVSEGAFRSAVAERVRRYLDERS